MAVLWIHKSGLIHMVETANGTEQSIFITLFVLRTWDRTHKTHLSATFSLKYGELPLKLRVSLMFQGLHLSIKGFTFLLRNSLNFLRFKGNLRDLIGPLKVALN